jgi:hypothetical protein
VNIESTSQRLYAMSTEKKISSAYRAPYSESSPSYTEALAFDGRQIDGAPAHYHERDVFGNEDDAAIKYKTLSWQLVAVLMIAEIVSNGNLHLELHAGGHPLTSTTRHVELAKQSGYCGHRTWSYIDRLPGNFCHIYKLAIDSIQTQSSGRYFLQVDSFNYYRSKIFVIAIQISLKMPTVHNMGDAGMIIGGPFFRELLAFGTVVFAVRTLSFTIHLTITEARSGFCYRRTTSRGTDCSGFTFG